MSETQLPTPYPIETQVETPTAFAEGPVVPEWRRRVAGAILALSAGSVAGALAETGTAQAAEIPFSISAHNPIARDCGSEVITLNTTISGQGISQSAILKLHILNSSGTEVWQTQFGPVADSHTYSIVLAPRGGVADYTQGRMNVTLEVDELDAVDNSTWYRNVASTTDVVEACAPTTTPTATHPPKPSHAPTPTMIPKPSQSPKPSSSHPNVVTPTPKPTASQESSSSAPVVVVAPQPPSSSLEAPASSASVASSVPESSSVNSPVASSPQGVESPLASSVALAAHNNNGGGGGSSKLPEELEVGLGGVVILGGLGYLGLRALHRRGGQPRAPRHGHAI